MKKHKESKFLLLDLLKGQPNKTMEESGLEYTKAVMYKVVLMIYLTCQMLNMTF